MNVVTIVQARTSSTRLPGKVLLPLLGRPVLLRLVERLHAARLVGVVGDGELNEGSNWEACPLANARWLDNLVVVVDRNGFQANVRTEALLPLEPLPLKFQAFGVEAARVDGHDFASLHALLSRLPLLPGAPSAVIAETVRGRGLPSIEARADRWFANFSAAELTWGCQGCRSSWSAACPACCPRPTARPTRRWRMWP